MCVCVCVCEESKGWLEVKERKRKNIDRKKMNKDDQYDILNGERKTDRKSL